MWQKWMVIMAITGLTACAADARQQTKSDKQKIERLQKVIVGQSLAQVQQQLGLSSDVQPIDGVLGHDVAFAEHGLNCHFDFYFENNVLDKWRIPDKVCHRLIFPVNDVYSDR